MTKGQEGTAQAIQEFGVIVGYRYGAMVCMKCGKEKSKPGWYHGMTIQHPCVACGGNLKFHERQWEPMAFTRISEETESPKITGRSKT